MPDTLQILSTGPSIDNALTIDTLSAPIVIPYRAKTDTVIDTDLDHALSCTYDISGVDIDALRVIVPPPPSTWEQGIQGKPRITNAGDDSGVLAIITGMFVMMMIGYKHCRRLFATLVKELLGMRRRANVFDEHTSNETRLLALMALQWSVYTGLLLYSFISQRYDLDVSRTLVNTLWLIGLMSVYYVFQLGAYSIVGYTFSTKAGQRYFVQGFTSSQSLLGFLLMIPALVAIFYPEAAYAMINTGIVLYLLARIIFIIKGFRIFYHKFSSLLYFILYLCTLEITPLIILYQVAIFLVNGDF